MNDAVKEIPAVELDDPRTMTEPLPMPSRAHTVTRNDGSTKTYLFRGLPYSRKSQLDAQRRIERAEEEKKGVAKPDLHGPRLIARAICTPDGKRAFRTDEEETLFAITIMDQLTDGELNRAANVVLELSGWGDEAEADAGKS
jgi:hypothetical protein